MTPDQKRKRKLQLELELRRRQRAKAAGVPSDLTEAMLAKEREREAGYESSQQALKSLGKAATETVKDVGVSTLQSASLEFGDELIGGAVAAWQKAKGDKRPASEIYKEMRDAIRNEVAGARQRSPISTFVADVVVPNPMKFVKYGKALSGPIATGAMTAAGYSEELEDMPVDVAVGSTIGAGVKAASKVAQSSIKDPRATEARYLGLREAPVTLKKGPASRWIDDIEKSLDRLREKGLFGKNYDKFSSRSKRWLANPLAGKIDKMKAAKPRDILKKMDEAISASSRKLDNILRKKSPEILEGEFVPSRKAITKPEFSTDEFGQIKKTEKVVGSVDYYPIQKEGIFTPDELQNDIEDIRNRILNQFGEEDGSKIAKEIEQSYNNLTKEQGAFTVKDLHEEKKRLYASLMGKYEDAHLSNAEKAAKKELARLYKNKINEYTNDPEIIELNQTMEDIFNFKDAVDKKIKQQFLESPMEGIKGSTYGGIMFRIERAIENIIDPSRPYRAKLGRIAEEHADVVDKAISGPQAAPVRALMRPYEKDQERVQSREPQSIAEDLVRTPLPRSSEEIIAKKDFILAKVAQQAPEMFDAIRDTIERDPQAISEVLPALVMAAPHLFERDPYNRIDGKIVDPQMREKATQDTMDDDDLSYLEKTLIINKLNKTGIFDAK